jgi:hypothetical protein
MTKINKDTLGLYIDTGGHICRPFFGTCFHEGETVKAHHFKGSTRVGVGLPNQAFFKKPETYELWSTTGTGLWEKAHPERWLLGDKKYKRWHFYVKACAEWYHKQGFIPEGTEHNKKYARDLGKLNKAYYGGQAQ